MAKFPPNIQVNYVREITPNQVMPLMIEHHLYCLPTQGENFRHSIFESFMIGRPVLISNKTPWLNLNEKMRAGSWYYTTKFICPFFRRSCKLETKGI